MPLIVVRFNPRRKLTDRAKRYRAQHNVKGPKRCVLCGSTRDLGVMHLSGDEDDGESRNLAWGCRSCNQKLSHAFMRLGSKIRTAQYNPSEGVPSFEQYAWAVQHHRRAYVRGYGWLPGEHDEGGAIIHATPKHKRIEYARRLAAFRKRTGAGGRSEVPF